MLFFYTICYHGKYLQHPKSLLSLALSLTFRKLLSPMFIPCLLLLQGHTNPLVYICMSRLVTERTGASWTAQSCQSSSSTVVYAPELPKETVRLGGKLYQLEKLENTAASLWECLCVGKLSKGQGFVLLPLCGEKKKSVYLQLFCKICNLLCSRDTARQSVLAQGTEILSCTFWNCGDQIVRRSQLLVSEEVKGKTSCRVFYTQ